MIMDARPGVIPTCIPKKSRKNCNANIISAYNATVMKGTFGGLIKKTAGILAKIKRRAQSNSGETSLRLNFTKIKFTPQTMATKIANKR